MDRLQMLLVGLPVFLLCSDVVNIFTLPRPPPRPHTRNHHHRPQPQHQHYAQPQFPVTQTLNFPAQKSTTFEGTGAGNTVNINFCSSCSYKGNAVTMKNMLEASFPGIEVILANHPPPLPKRLLSKVVPVVQLGIFGIIIAGEQIFPRLGIAPPAWYYSLRGNRFGTLSTTWLLGNFLQSFLQSSGAFEVYCNGEPVFSKLNEHRFPGEIELRDIIGRRISSSTIVNGPGGNIWS